MKVELKKDTLEELYDDSKFIGILWAKDLYKTTLVKTRTGTTALKLSTMDITQNWSCKSKEDYIIKLFKSSLPNKAYMFDTEQELFNWLLNKNAM